MTEGGLLRSATHQPHCRIRTRRARRSATPLWWPKPSLAVKPLPPSSNGAPHRGGEDVHRERGLPGQRQRRHPTVLLKSAAIHHGQTTTRVYLCSWPSPAALSCCGGCRGDGGTSRDARTTGRRRCRPHLQPLLSPVGHASCRFYLRPDAPQPPLPPTGHVDAGHPLSPPLPPRASPVVADAVAATALRLPRPIWPLGGQIRLRRGRIRLRRGQIRPAVAIPQPDAGLVAFTAVALGGSSGRPRRREAKSPAAAVLAAAQLCRWPLKRRRGGGGRWGRGGGRSSSPPEQPRGRATQESMLASVGD
ncbi:hypothetical protein OsI_28040 [Oryza sativa Indica Group]|uniref:Uncharacterized protein n=1 Tax=Oryza sativa subsp. indica TaxID=39946 RepID=B8BBD2_ORYSI|nr:hypothetical protein OsI_28040 [Oryza sativa Indica Group]